jgi:hypothetical protein
MSSSDGIPWTLDEAPGHSPSARFVGDAVAAVAATDRRACIAHEALHHRCGLRSLPAATDLATAINRPRSASARRNGTMPPGKRFSLTGVTPSSDGQFSRGGPAEGDYYYEGSRLTVRRDLKVGLIVMTRMACFIYARGRSDPGAAPHLHRELSQVPCSASSPARILRCDPAACRGAFMQCRESEPRSSSPQVWPSWRDAHWKW